MKRLALALVFAAGSGCVGSELLAPHVEPGGAIHAQLDGGPDRVCTALADATQDPLRVSGSSPAVAFGLVLPHADVTMPLTVALDTPGLMLQVHADGSGCTAQSGTLMLSPDPQGGLDGTFSGTGTRDTGASCTLDGTLAQVPIQK